MPPSEPAGVFGSVETVMGGSPPTTGICATNSSLLINCVAGLLLASTTGSPRRLIWESSVKKRPITRKVSVSEVSAITSSPAAAGLGAAISLKASFNCAKPAPVLASGPMVRLDCLMRERISAFSAGSPLGGPSGYHDGITDLNRAAAPAAWGAAADVPKKLGNWVSGSN